MITLFKYIIALVFIFRITLSAQIDISIPDTTEESGKNIEIPINVTDLTGLKIRSYYLEINYNKDLLKAKSIIDNGTLSDKRGWDIDAGFTKEGIYIKADGSRYLTGGGKLIIVKFEVIAKEGYTDLILSNVEFNNGNPTSSSTNGSFTVFSVKEILFSSTGNGSGNIYLNGEKLDIPTKLNLISGKIYNLKAEPLESSTFNEWQGGISTSFNPIDFTVENSTEIIAKFSLKKFSVTTNSYPEGYGSVNGAGIYNYDDYVELDAIPHTGMEFINWTIDGEEVSRNPIYSFNVLNNIDINANFSQVLFYVSALSLPGEAGQITGSGYYYSDQTALIEANSNNGWSFSYWSENDSIISYNPNIEFNVNLDRNLIANFTSITNVAHNEERVEFYIDKPYPNPFNPSSNFQFGIQNTSEVKVSIFDITGKKIVDLINNELPSGNYKEVFRASNLSSGVYFYNIIIKDLETKEIKNTSGKLLLIK